MFVKDAGLISNGTCHAHLSKAFQEGRASTLKTHAARSGRRMVAGKCRTSSGWESQQGISIEIVRIAKIPVLMA